MPRSPNEFLLQKTKKAMLGWLVLAFTFTASVLNSSDKTIDMEAFQNIVKSQLEQSYSGQFKTKEGKTVNVTMDAVISEINSKDERPKNNHLIEIKNDDEPGMHGVYGYASDLDGNAMIGGKGLMLNAERVEGMMDGSDNNTIPHEVGHTGGLYHPDVDEGLKEVKIKEGQYFRPFKGVDTYNLMYSNTHLRKNDGAVNLDDKHSIDINQRQIHAIIKKIKSNQINLK